MLQSFFSRYTNIMYLININDKKLRVIVVAGMSILGVVLGLWVVGGSVITESENVKLVTIRSVYLNSY